MPACCSGPRKKAERQNAETYEERKRKAIEKGSATEIAPFVKDMTKDELRDARNRLEEQEKFMQLVVKESPQAIRRAKAQKVFDTVEIANKNVNTAIDTYNTFARVHNALSTGNEWPIIPGKGAKNNSNNNNNNSSDDNPGKSRKEIRRENAKRAISEFNDVANKKKKK